MPSDNRLNVDPRYVQKPDCTHDMDSVKVDIKELHKKIDDELPKKFASNDKVKPLLILAYATAVSSISGLIGLLFTFLGRK